MKGAAHRPHLLQRSAAARAVGQQHEIPIPFRIDPHGRPRKPDMPECASATSMCRRTRRAASCPTRARASLRARSLFVVNCATSSGENGGGAPRSPRAARRTTRANAPTAGALPNSPACPAVAAERGRVIVVHFAGERPAAARIFDQRLRRRGEPLKSAPKQSECHGRAGVDDPASRRICLIEQAPRAERPRDRDAMNPSRMKSRSL